MNMRINFTLFSTIPAQVILLICSALTITYLFYNPVTTFKPIDKTSFVKQVDEQTITAWGKNPARVKTGFIVHDFLQFDVIKNSFLLNAVISFDFDPTEISQEAIDKFSFTKGDIVKKSEPLVKRISPHRTFIEYAIRIQFSALLNYGMFPLDDHHLYLNFTNTAVDAHDVIFDIQQEDFVVPSYLFLEGWNIASYRAVYGYTEFGSQKGMVTHYPKISLAIEIQKVDLRQLFLIMIPLLILFYCCVFSLSIKSFDTNVQEMFPLLTAFVAYVIVIQSMAPQVSYFMLIDYLILFFMFMMFLICVVNFLCIAPEKMISENMVAQIRGCFVLLVHVALILMMAYLTRIS